MRRVRVAVVGGGISGLATAWALAGSLPGTGVVVLEASDRIGGCLRRGSVGAGGPVVDLGAESLLARRPEALDLTRAVGLAADLVHPATTRAAVWSRGALHPLPAGTVMGVPGEASALAGILDAPELARAAGEQLTPPLGADGDVDVAGWVGARLGPAVVDRLVEPLLGGVHAGSASRLSLRSTIPALWPAARDGLSLTGAVRAAGAAAAAGPAGAPVFAGITGGVARLAEATATALAAAGVDVRTAAAVRALTREAGRWRLDVGGAGGDAGADVVHADAVVLAVPAPAAAAVLAGVAPDAAAELGRVATAGLALVSAVLPAGSLDALTDAGGAPLSGVLVPPVEGRLVKAMTASSRKWPWVARAAGGAEVIRLSVGRAGEQRGLAVGDAQLASAALADASDLLGMPLPAQAWRVTRWRQALPQHEVGHSARLARVERAVAQLPALALAGAVWDGVGVPACVARAQRAARQVLDDVQVAGGGWAHELG